MRLNILMQFLIIAHSEWRQMKQDGVFCQVTPLFCTTRVSVIASRPWEAVARLGRDEGPLWHSEHLQFIIKLLRWWFINDLSN